MPSRESLYSKMPDYEVSVSPTGERIRVCFAGETIVDTQHAITVSETNHAPVLYFPRSDVRFEHLERTEHQTFCPFKGDAGYWSLRVGDACSENAVWGYDDPFPEVEPLKDYVAFYAERVDIERLG